VWGFPAGLGVASIAVVYEGQCYGHIPLRGWARRRERALADVVAPLSVDEFLRQVAQRDPSKAAP
jgi:hypothetical protein